MSSPGPLRAAAVLLACLVAPLAGPPAAQALSWAGVARPAGARAGTVLVVHGGAWWLVGPRATASTMHVAERYAAAGWEGHNVDYRAWERSYPDVRAYYDALRRRRPDETICAYGASAGGQLALMLAADRPSLDCVVADSAPTDLVAWPAAYGGVRDATAELAARRVSLRRWSPARRAEEIGRPVVLVHDPADPVVPYEQSVRLRRRLPDARLVTLCAGTVAHVHTNVGAGCAARAHAAELRLLGRAARLRSRSRPARASRRTRSRPPSRRWR